MKQPSLRSQERAEEIFEQIKKALVRDGRISPVAYVALKSKDTGTLTLITLKLDPPNDALGKEIYYAALKEELRNKGTILEALTVYEGWGVISKTTPNSSSGSMVVGSRSGRSAPGAACRGERRRVARQ
jgi:hypothetical protein